MTNRALVLVTVVGATLALATTATASCLPSTPAQQRARADAVFTGVALEGPTATGVQRFKVTRYLKGSGPKLVRVQTGTIRRPDGTGSTTSISLSVKKGQRWRIFARGNPRRVMQTNLCDGSRLL